MPVSGEPLQMLRRHGVGASTSLAPVVHAEDAQPNEVSKKRKGQGLPPIVASSKPPARTSFNRRGGGRGAIRGGYRGGRETDVGTSTQCAIRGGKSSWRGHRNPSGNWPRRVDSAFPSPYDPSSNRRPAVAIPIHLTAGQTGIDNGKAPMRRGEQSMHMRWHHRDDIITHRNLEQDRRASPWGQQPDSGYAQRAVPRPIAPPKVDGQSPAPLPHVGLLHSSLPAKPPPQLYSQSPPQPSSYLLQPGPQDSRASAVTEWYLRTDSPEPKLPPGSLGRKNTQPQPTISMPLPGRLRKLQDRQDTKAAAENVSPIPPQPEMIASFPATSPVQQKPQPKPELFQVPIPLDIPKEISPKRITVETPKPANHSTTENLAFVPPEDESNVYKTIPLSDQRKPHSRPRDVSLPVPLQAEAEASAYRSESLSQQHKALHKPPCDVKPTFTHISLPSSSKLQSHPSHQSKAATSVPTNPPETDALSFLPPQSASGAYVPVPLSLQQQSRMSLYAMSSTSELQADESRLIPIQELSTFYVPTPVSQQRKAQPDSFNLSEPQPKVIVDSSRSSSHAVAHPTHVKAQVQAPESNLPLQTKAKLGGSLKPVNDALSGEITVARATVSSTPPSIYDLVTLPPPKTKPPNRAPPMTPRRTQTSQASDTRTGNEMRTSVLSPKVVVKKEEQLSPLSQSPIKPMRKLVTEAASFYPMPTSCDKAVPAYKENRKIFFKENSKKLSALGLKRTKAFFRDDGLVIEWKSEVPVWSDTLKPEENNLATAMEEFLRQSAERSGDKRKRKGQDTRDEDGHELSPGAKRIRTSKEMDPLSLSERKRRITELEDTRLQTRGERLQQPGRCPSTNGPLGLSLGDVTSSKDEPIYILSSPESSPKATLKLLPTATVKKIPLPTRLHMTEKPNGALSMSTGAADSDPERAKLPARTSIDPIQTVTPVASQSDGRIFASGPPLPSRKMIFKPTNPHRTSRVTSAACASASTLPAEECSIGQHSVGAVHIADLNPVTAPTHLDFDGRSTSRAYSPTTTKDELLPVKKAVEDHNSVIQMVLNGLSKPLVMETTASHIGDMGDHDQRENNSDIYCSEHEDVREDDGDENDESKLAVDFFTRFITFLDSDRSKLVSAYAKNALFTCRVHDLRPRSVSVAENVAPESKLLFHSSHSNASASTVEHGRHRICNRLRTMGPHKFRGSVVWDLAPLPLDSPGHLMFSVHGEVVDPSHAGRHLDHILTVDQTFVLRPRTEDDNAHDEESLSDSLHDGEEWPLVAISHQMTVRESRLLPPDAITNLLPWVVGIGS